MKQIAEDEHDITCVQAWADVAGTARATRAGAADRRPTLF